MLEGETSMKSRQRNLEITRIVSGALLLAFASFAMLLTTASPVEAQYTNPYTGATWNNPVSRIMDMTRTWNQNLWDAQRNVDATKNRLRELAGATSASSSSAAPNRRSSSSVAPPLRHFPITATDFSPSGTRLLLEDLVAASPGVTNEQRVDVRRLYQTILTSFESEARKNNVANAFAFAVGVSLQVLSGKEIPDAEVDLMIKAFNDSLGGIAQFNAMPSQQKQMLYEALVITGGIIAFLDGQGKLQNNAEMQSQAKELSKAVLRQLMGVSIP
jgi:hypothetical protein